MSGIFSEAEARLSWPSMVDARERIAPRIRLTPCRRSSWLGGAVGGEVYLKLENLQETGSFKLRGVVNKILSLAAADAERPLVAASTGNHGAAFAHAVAVFGRDGRLFMPRTAQPSKVERVRSTGMDVELVGEDCVEAERAGAERARAAGAVWISPYNDPEVIQGQGTTAVELIEQLGGFDDVLVPVGGGGLIAGIAGCLASIAPSTRVSGCQPRNSCVMAQSIEAGRIVDVPSLPTLSDATAGGIEPGSVTFEICRRLVDEMVLVDEDEIAAAVRALHDNEGLVVEGAGALPVAALLKNHARFAGRRTVLVISGGSIDRETLNRIGCEAASRV